MKAEHVLIIVENMPVPQDRRVWQEALALRASGRRVTVICPRGRADGAPYEQLEGIEIHRHELPAEPSGALGYLREYGVALLREWQLARRIHARDPFRVIHLCNPPDFLFLVALPFKWLHGVAVIFDHHDLSPELYRTKYERRGLFHRALVWAERCAFSVADVVISSNDSYKEIALRRGHVSPERLFVVRSAPDLERFAVPREDRRNGRRNLIGYVGVLGEQDGIDVLLRAAKRLIDTEFGDDLHVLIIGDGPYASRLQELARDLGLGGQCEFAGWRSGPDLVGLLAACDVCVCPDPVTDFTQRSTMIKVLEYMAMGKPVVQFESIEARRSAGDAALYAAPGDEDAFARHIADLLRSPSLREELGRAGRRRVEDQLSWAHQVPQLLAAYEKARELRMGER